MAFDLEFVQDLSAEYDNHEPKFQAAFAERQSILKRLAFHTGIIRFDTDKNLTDDQIKILTQFMALIKQSHPPKQPQPLSEESRKILESIWEVDDKNKDEHHD